MSEQSNEPIQPKPHRRRFAWLIVIIFLIGAGIFWVARGKSSRKNAADSQPSRQGTPDGSTKPGSGRPGAGGPIMVGVTNAHTGDIGVYVSALGIVTPLNTVAVRSRVEGQLIKIYYTEGQFVKEGDPLGEIDPAPFEAALAQAEGQLARDSASLENARLDFQRYKDAFARNAVPKQQLDTQTSSVRQFEGAVKFDQGQVDTAKVQLNYSHIRAPISGRVGLRLIDAGNIVRASDTNPLVVITQIKPITVVFSVAEDYLPQIQKQMHGSNQLSVDAYDRALEKKIASGKLQTIDNQIDVGTGTVKLKAIFANDDEALFPNQFVNARLLVETHHSVTLVPNRAIQRGAQGAFVFVLKEDQTIVAQPFEAGASDSNVTEAGGLKPGTMIALDNFNRLSDGAKVTIRGSQQGQGRPEGQRRPQGSGAGEKKGGS
jgi:multidrug efflux system membrane fusion protein